MVDTIKVLDADSIPVVISTNDALIKALAGGTAGTPGGDVNSVQGVEGGLPLAIANATYTSTVVIVRPADTAIPYAANDVIGIEAGGAPGSAVLVFAAIGPEEGGAVLLTTATLEIDVNALPLGMADFRLELYASAPPSAKLDNDAFDLGSNDRSAYRDFIDLGTPIDKGSTLFASTDAINKQIVVPAGGVLYGYLVTNGAYPPGSSAVFRVRLHSIGI